MLFCRAGSLEKEPKLDGWLVELAPLVLVDVSTDLKGKKIRKKIFISKI